TFRSIHGIRHLCSRRAQPAGQDSRFAEADQNRHGKQGQADGQVIQPPDDLPQDDVAAHAGKNQPACGNQNGKPQRRPVAQKLGVDRQDASHAQGIGRWNPSRKEDGASAKMAARLAVSSKLIPTRRSTVARTSSKTAPTISTASTARWNTTSPAITG